MRTDEPALLQRLIAVLKREGAAGIASRVMARVVDVRTHLLLECDLTVPRPVPAAPDARFGWASLEDLARYPSFELVATPDRRAACEKRLRQGDRCLVGHCAGQPATYLWITTTQRELPRLRWPVRPRAAFVYKTFTVDSWRGRGLNRAAVAFALDDCRTRGAHTAFVDVEATNLPSLRALRSVGFRDVARFRTLKIGPTTFTLMSGTVYARVSGRMRRTRGPAPATPGPGGQP